MNIFKIDVVTNEETPKFRFSDECASILIDEYDFSGLDTGSNNYTMQYTVLWRRKITNIQLKKKLKRTMNNLLKTSVTDFIKDSEVQ